MRMILTAAAFASAFAITAAKAEPNYVAGGPIQQGNLCQVDTDLNGDSNYGIWQPCPNQPVQSRRRAKQKS